MIFANPMSVGVWEPGSDAGELNKEVLQRLLTMASGVQDSVTSEALDDADLSTGQWLMKLTEADWQIAADCSDGELVALIRFFTLVEMQISGWDAGKNSPVIPLVKQLKARDGFPSELRKWVKTNTRNRYLPYGSAL